jgi:hypothetical protein
MSKVYDVAEVLSFNKQYFKDILYGEYRKADKLPSEEACLHIEQKLKEAVAMYTTFNIEEVEDAFDDPRIATVVQAYYTSQYIIKH